MKCTKCGFENPEGAKFCCSCGTKFEELKACSNPKCSAFGKHILPSDSRFCPTCGEKIVQVEFRKNSSTSLKTSLQSNGNSLSKKSKRLDIKYKVKEIIVEKLGVDISQVTDDANFALDLNADSLDVVEIIMAVESEFGISIPDIDTLEISTVADAINYVQEMCDK